MKVQNCNNYSVNNDDPWGGSHFGGGGGGTDENGFVHDSNGDIDWKNSGMNGYRRDSSGESEDDILEHDDTAL